MNLPGFTAENSLQSNGHYRAMPGAFAGFTNLRGVVPQLPIGFCQANCDRISDSFLRSVCNLNCLDSGGSGGGGVGGGGHVCRPACGRCYPNEDSPTGLSRLCILRNCEDVERPCRR